MNEIERIQKLELKRKEQNRKIRNAKKKAREKVQLQIAEYLFEICGWTGRNKDNYIEELDLEKFKSFCNEKKRVFIKQLKYEQYIEKPKKESSNSPNNAGLEQEQPNTRPIENIPPEMPYNQPINQGNV